MSPLSLGKNDWDLVHVRIGWPFLSESVLEEVVKVISCNHTVERLDIRDGDKDLLPRPWSNIQPWWNGREEYITELLKSALENNTSIKEIHLKKCGPTYINKNLVKHS